MISDTLFEAAASLRKYATDPAFSYDADTRADALWLVLRMEELRGALDSPHLDDSAPCFANELRQVQPEHVATKADLALLREDMNTLRSALESSTVGSAAETRVSLMKWLTAAFFAQTGLIVALLRLF